MRFYSLPPATKLGKVMFLQASVILLTGGGTSHTPGSRPPPQSRPPGSRHPPEQTLPPGADTPPSRPRPPGAGRPRLGAGTPRSRHPPEADPPPQSRHPSPRPACCEIRSTRGRYASYRNAISLSQCVCPSFSFGA